MSSHSCSSCHRHSLKTYKYSTTQLIIFLSFSLPFVSDRECPLHILINTMFLSLALLVRDEILMWFVSVDLFNAVFSPERYRGDRDPRSLGRGGGDEETITNATLSCHHYDFYIPMGSYWM